MQPPASAFETVLLDERAVSHHDVANLRRHAERHQVPPADALVALGLMAEGDAYGLLARATGLPLVPLEDAQPSELALRLVPERLARRHMVVPLQVDNRTLTYATCRPFDIEAERDLSFASGRSTSSVLATRSAVLAALDRVYPKLRELEGLAD